MKLSIRNVLYAMRSFATVLVVSLYVFPVSAEDKTPDIQAYLPLFERNSLGRKILDVRYSLKYERHVSGVTSSGKQDARLVFDVETGKYREEIKDYGNTNDTNVYSFAVNIWDGNKAVEWMRHVSQKPGSRLLGGNVCEAPGAASILSQPCRPFFVFFYYLTNDRPLAKVLSEKNSRLTSIAGDVITIETEISKFSFSKKTGALEQIISYDVKPPPNDNEKMIWNSFNLSNHVECSGFLIPLRFIRIWYDENGKIKTRDEYSVDPQTLRMLDEVDVSIFSEVLQAGCVVNDEIEKRDYTVTTVGALPKDVEAVKKSLEQMLEKAQEQKAAVEKKK